MITKISATPKEIAATFTEWDRRFREDPEGFQSEATRLLKETPESYGAAVTPYFAKLLGEIRKKSGRKVRRQKRSAS